uniref:Zinc finger protein 385A n=1 Tax=Canis lupus familiaris TaxID=9615 RepID=A0A8P0NR81_CANLF
MFSLPFRQPEPGRAPPSDSAAPHHAAPAGPQADPALPTGAGPHPGPLQQLQHYGPCAEGRPVPHFRGAPAQDQAARHLLQRLSNPLQFPGQAEAHYKGNRHARRVKGIEAAKTRGREPGAREPGDPAPPGGAPPNGDGAAARPVSMENGLGPAPGSPEKQPGSPSPPSIPETGQGTTKGEGGTPAPAALPGGSKEEEEKAKRLLYCALCKVAVNSLSQLEAHNKGTKHKTILEARSGLGPIKAYPRLGPPTPGEPEAPAQDRTFHCEICNVKVNSEVQLKQHISSRRHRDGVAGKPNPLLSRHKKPRGAAELAGTLTFSKELPKSLAGGLLPSPLAVAAVMAAAAGSPLSLRPAPAAPLLQGPPITHPLLHPAPGPIRTAHGPILFSPY